MSKFLRWFFIAIAAVCTTHLGAYTEKTFLMPRSHGVNLALESTAFNEVIYRKAANSFGGNFQVAGFYTKSVGGTDIGKYFGVAEKNELTFGKIHADGTSDTKVSADLIFGWLEHNKGATDTTQVDAGKLKFDPEHTGYGVNLYYHQDLEKVLKGLYLKVALPIVHVENDIKISSSGVEAKCLLEFFGGELENTDASNLTEKLTHGLIKGKQSATGIADIDLTLGYHFLNKDDMAAAINLGLTVPTGNESDGKYMFEPIYGNGGHFGFGGGLLGSFQVWGDANHNFKLNAAMNYRYLFKGTEKRILGLPSLDKKEMSVYALLGKNNQKGCVPAPNILTRNVNVTPGSQMDGIVGLGYNNEGFTIDLGYNLFFREAESVSLKDKFTDGEYGIAKRDYDTSSAFNFSSNKEKEISNTTVRTSAAETPSQLTHKFYGGLGYIFRDWEYPLMLGAGGHYEIASKNSAIDTWGFNLKFGLGF
jgi:hypothetical protein